MFGPGRISITHPSLRLAAYMQMPTAIKTVCCDETLLGNYSHGKIVQIFKGGNYAKDLPF